MEIPKNKVIVFPMIFNFAPTDLPIITVVPIAIPTIITVIICITWLPIETAVVPETESNCPIINKSAIPYSVCKKYDKKYGSENLKIFLPILPCVKSRSIKNLLFIFIYSFYSIIN